MDQAESDEAKKRQCDGGEGTNARRHRGTAECTTTSPKRQRGNPRGDGAKRDPSGGSGGRMPPPLGECSPAPLPGCAAPTPVEQLPHALTFFLTAGQRRAVLENLRTHHARRAEALLRALGIEHD